MRPLSSRRNVYLEPPSRSRGLHRVRDALVRYAPAGVQIVDRPEDADLLIVHVIGRRDQVQAQVDAHVPHRRVVLIQYCVRSTQKPHTSAWVELWGSVDLVWSYYDLTQLMAQDGVSPPATWQFYLSPLGVDPQVFMPRHEPHRPFLVATHGPAATAEGSREVAKATAACGALQWHLGPLIPSLGDHVLCEDERTDAWVAFRLNQCAYTAPLRRMEGFEFLAVEGLLCGARPILFDIPQYREWYSDLAEFIPEGSRSEVIEALVDLFCRPVRPVTDATRSVAIERFSWPTILTEFWGQCLSAS